MEGVERVRALSEYHQSLQKRSSVVSTGPAGVIKELDELCRAIVD